MTENKELFNFTEQDQRNNDFYNFDENPILDGFLINIEEGVFGDNYLIEQKETKKLVIVGSKTALKGKLKKEDIGKAIRIHFIGLERSSIHKGQVYQNFKVYVKNS